MNVFASTAKALNQDEIAHGPPDRVDGALHHCAIAVQQCHMRRESQCYSAKSDISHRSTKQPMESNQRRFVAGAQYEWPKFALGSKAHRTIQHDIERLRQKPRHQLPSRVEPRLAADHRRRRYRATICGADQPRCDARSIRIPHRDVGEVVQFAKRFPHRAATQKTAHQVPDDVRNREGKADQACHTANGGSSIP